MVQLSLIERSQKNNRKMGEPSRNIPMGLSVVREFEVNHGHGSEIIDVNIEYDADK